MTINNCWEEGGVIMFPAYHFEPSRGNNGFFENGMLLQIPEQLQCEDKTASYGMVNKCI